MSAEGLRSQQAKASILILATIIVSATMGVEAMARSLPRIGTGTPMGIEGVAHVTVTAKTLMHRDHGVRPAALRHWVD